MGQENQWSFGGWMGNMEGTCGVFVGAGIVLHECSGCMADAAEFLKEQLNNLEKQ